MLGYLATAVIAGIENAVVWGLGALGAALYSAGIPKDSVIKYETAVKEDDFLVMARGKAEEMAHAKAILGEVNPSHIDVYAGAKAG